MGPTFYAERMATDIPEPGADDDARQTESALLSGLRSAIASHSGPLDQSEIDAVLGVTPLEFEGTDADLESGAG